ncbi:MAG: phosphomannomutase [Porticoccaceae bacterium]
MHKSIPCFKAYDIRGQVPDELNEDVAYRIGRAFAQYLHATNIVIGHDIRLSSPMLSSAVESGILDAGCNVVHIGECGTEEIYHATFHGGYDGGLMITGSHNPKEFNGLKFVKEGARPISGDDGLPEIQALAEAGEFSTPLRRGEVTRICDKNAYNAHLLSYIDVAAIKPLTIVVNAGNGGAGAIIDLLEPYLPLSFIKLHHAPDGNFPNGVPNPLLPENRQDTSALVKNAGADLGVAWDGDFDRCFFFDETGDFIEGYYLVGLLAEAFLTKNDGGTIVHDPRLTWNTLEIVTAFNGNPVQSKTGHSFIKQSMRDHSALYGGEMSAHHYFKDFAYCDSGMIPWLLVVELLSMSGKKLSELVAQRQAAFPVSGEINRRITDPTATLDRVLAHYSPQALRVDRTDGVSIEFPNWRFNVRLSNTEPLVRLNVETRGDRQLMEAKTEEVLTLLDG